MIEPMSEIVFESLAAAPMGAVGRTVFAECRRARSEEARLSARVAELKEALWQVLHWAYAEDNLREPVLERARAALAKPNEGG